MDGRAETVGGECQLGVDSVRPGVLVIRMGPFDEPGDRFDGKAGGHFSSGVATHAVRDDEQAQLLVEEQRWLVGPPDRPPSRAGRSLKNDHTALSDELKTERVEVATPGGNATLVVVRWPNGAGSRASGQAGDELRPAVDPHLIEYTADV